MKRIVIGLILFLTITGCSAENVSEKINNLTQTKPSIVGTWENHLKNEMWILKEKGEMIVINPDGTTMKSGAITDYNGQIKNASLTYAIDYSQNPIWFDITLDIDNGSERTTALGILNFISNDTIEVITNSDSSIRPNIIKKANDNPVIFNRKK